MPVDTKTLMSLELFTGLSQEEIEPISQIINLAKVIEGETLTNRHTPAQTFFINLTGNFMVSYEEDRTLTLHNRNDLIGLSAVLSPFRHMGTAIALTAGDVLTIQGQALLRLIQENSELGDKVMKKINQTLSDRKIFTRES